ncbi:hypothetical protein CYL18_05610 [Pradoshia eiseniae]|uniref:Uncharacterized protein n=1 Tax=Pradoshia eiseniae TaxID=2064768 RepID=A0A2S7N258_9BACI|nr:hypothetical protein CYL18_05610 [Pradoshia eiseniae]
MGFGVNLYFYGGLDYTLLGFEKKKAKNQENPSILYKGADFGFFSKNIVRQVARLFFNILYL